MLADPLAPSIIIIAITRQRLLLLLSASPLPSSPIFLPANVRRRHLPTSRHQRQLMHLSLSSTCGWMRFVRTENQKGGKEIDCDRFSPQSAGRNLPHRVLATNSRPVRTLADL